MCVCAHMWGCVCMWRHVEASGRCQVSSSVTLHLVFWISVSLNLDFTGRVACPSLSTLTQGIQTHATAFHSIPDNSIYLLCVYLNSCESVCMWACMCHNIHVGVRRQLAGVRFLFHLVKPGMKLGPLISATNPLTG